MTRAFHPSRLPGFLPAPPSIVFDLCRSKGRRRKPIRCGPHRVVNELRRRSALSNRHFTRHSAFLSPSPLHLEYICRPFLFAPGCPSGPLQIGSAIFPPLALSICCHITAAENYQENSGGHRQRLLAHPRPLSRSPQPISFNRSKAKGGWEGGRRTP